LAALTYGCDMPKNNLQNHDQEWEVCSMRFDADFTYILMSSLLVFVILQLQAQI